VVHVLSSPYSLIYDVAGKFILREKFLVTLDNCQCNFMKTYTVLVQLFGRERGCNPLGTRE
jgi:hypothetical protein